MADLDRQVDHLAREIRALVGDAKTRQLTAVHVSCPEGVSPGELKGQITASLAEYGLDFVDVRPRPEPGPVRLLAAYVSPRSGLGSDTRPAQGGAR